MIKKIFLPAMISLILGACLYFSISAYLIFKDSYIEVPVASHTLFQRTKLTQEDLEMMLLPKTYLGNDVCIDKDEILDRYVRLGFSLAKGSLIYKGSIEDDIADLAATMLKKGEAAYDLYIGEVKLNAGNIGMGMNVDLYLSIRNGDLVLSDLLMEGCRIVGIYDTQGKPIRSYDKETRAAIVTIAVQKENIPLLNKALMVGNLSVSLSEKAYDMNERATLKEDTEVWEFLKE